MTALIQRARALPPGGVVALALLLLTAFLWLPFGLNVGFTGDEWIYFHQISQGSIMSQAAPTRIFWPIPYLIAYPIDPAHFASFNLFLALLMFCKGILVYALLRRFAVPRSLAFAAAALAILIPVDSGAFYLGAMSIEFAVVCYLLALYLLIVYWNQRYLPLLVIISAAQLGAVGMYELVYPLIAVTPLVLLWFRRKIDGRFIRTALFWYLAPALYAAWYLFIILNFPRAFQYQNGMIEHSTLPTALISLLNIYKHHFFDAWFAPLATIPAGFIVLALLAGILAAALSWRLPRAENSAERKPLPPLLLALSGAAILLLGVALYLPTSLRDETFRTFYFSSVGAALTLAALFWWAARRPLIFALLVGLFAGLGTLHLLAQHQEFYDRSKQQQAAWTQFARALPNVTPGNGVVLVDTTPDHALANLLNPLYVEDIVPLIYSDDSLEGALCLESDFGTSDAARCRFSDDDLTLPSVRTRVFVRPYNQLIFVRYDGAFSLVTDLTPYAGHPVAAYQPEKLTQPSESLPPRLTALFGS